MRRDKGGEERRREKQGASCGYKERQTILEGHAVMIVDDDGGGRDRADDGDDEDDGVEIGTS
eukprot:757576-Hanusia_phi.AAC.3